MSGHWVPSAFAREPIEPGERTLQPADSQVLKIHCVPILGGIERWRNSPGAKVREFNRSVQWDDLLIEELTDIRKKWRRATGSELMARLRVRMPVLTSFFLSEVDQGYWAFMRLPVNVIDELVSTQLSPFGSQI